MDMVVEKNDDVHINFDIDPLTPRIVDNKWLMATGTSLGADNGIGIATCFAILEDNSIEHGPLEVLVTRDEETGMYGATDLEPGVLKAKYMINVDSEEENAICIGCAGGFTVSMHLATPREAFQNSRQFTLTLNNFVGGHSGCDIDLGRANPLHVMSRLVSAAQDDYRIVSIQCGSADNAIPRKCVMTVAVAAEQVESFKKSVEHEFACFQKEYHQIEKEATFAVEEAKEERLPISKQSTTQFVNFLNVCPFGVQRYSPTIKNTVETSMTCAIAKTLESEITFIASVRSSSATQMDMMYNKLKCVTSMAGMTLSAKKAPCDLADRVMCRYPGWDPKADSVLTQAMVKAYEESEHITPKVYSIHAGLECGLFQEKYPGMDCVSIGPELQSPHSPSERLLIESVPRYYNTLLVALKKLWCVCW